MSRTLWRSLRTRIVLLAIVTCVFLAIAVGSLYSSIRGSHQAIVGDATRHLSLVASAMARAYSIQAAHGVSLRNLPYPAPRHGPPPPPPAPDNGDKAPGPPPPAHDNGDNAPGPPPPPPPPPDAPLAQLAGSVLQKEEGIEGGFLAGAGPLVGYAFPTHEGPGGQKEMPQRERPTIDELTHAAEATGSAQSFVFEGPHDVVLFSAQPVREEVAGAQQVTGAAWVMQRLPDINRGRSQQLLLASLGFGAAALVTALLAWFVNVEVSGGVRVVTQRLASLEEDLAQPSVPPEHRQLAEFERVLSGINAMAVSLRHRITNERTLEDRLRHKERLSSLGQFAAGVAHELRNPLATIRLRAQMSQHASTEETIARNSRVILEEVDRLDAMIGRLLYFARPISLDLQPMNVGELCFSVLRSWESRAPAQMRLSCDVAGDLEVVADRNRLLQVLDNLIENAVQASSGASGEVLLQAAQREGAIQIDVLDGGSGFAPDALKHAFDPFYTTKETGTGLGLSIAFELVEAHGGELRAAARPGGGAIVSIVLPQTAAMQEARS